MLWGLLAVAIPIIVHLFNFRRYRKVYFSDVSRLEELQATSRRRRTVHRWLLLSMRILAIVFLVLAFAQPYMPAASLHEHNGGTAVSIFVDNSFSMQSNGSDGSLMEMARTKAREIAMSHRADDRFQLLTADCSGEAMRQLNRDEFIQAIDNLQPSPASPMLSSVYALQHRFLSSSRQPNCWAYVLSDFQQGNSDISNLAPDTTTHTILIPLQSAVADNIFIDTMWIEAPALFVGGSADVQVVVRNGSDSKVDKLPLRLFIDGYERAVATIDIAPRGSAKAMLRFSVDRPGWHDGVVELDDYPVTFDDRYLFSYFAGGKVRVCEIYSSSPNSHLHRLFAADSAFEFRSFSLSTYNIASLDEFDFVILSNVASLPSGTAAQLSSWLADGGSLLFLPPSATSVESLNAMLSAWQGPTLTSWANRRLRAAKVDIDNRLYRNVFVGRNDEMEMPDLFAGYVIERGTSVSQSIIAMADGSDFLTHTAVGDGHLYMLACPLDTTSTNFPSQALFVPTMLNMALYSHRQPVVSHLLDVATPIVLSGNYSSSEILPHLVAADGFDILPDVRRSGGRWLLALHGQPSVAGVYLLNDEHLSLNYNRRESDLQFLSASDIVAATDDMPSVSTMSNPNRPIDEMRGGSPRTLWRLCLVLALLALAVETLLLRLCSR